VQALPAPVRTRPRLSTVAIVALTGLLLVFALLEALFVLPAAAQRPDVTIGLDVRPYLDRTRDWLDGIGFYLPRQLTGEPYVIESGDALYPPPILYLLVPFAVGLPLFLWWVVPIAVTVLALVRARPVLWAMPILAAVGCYPRTWTILVLGNPAMWAIAAAVAGVAWGWPGVGALLKPTLAPFALVGARRRSWWIALVVGVAVSVPFGGLWLDFVTAIVNAHNTRGLEYPLGEWPIAAALVVVAMSGSLSRGGAGSLTRRFRPPP